MYKLQEKPSALKIEHPVLRNMNFFNFFIFISGSGSGIRCLFDPWIRDPGWLKIKIRIKDDHPGSYFRELRNNT
jgi:hypothetical protein